MKKLISGLLAVLLVSSGWALAPETARQGKHGVKTLMGVFNDGGNLTAMNIRLNASGEVIVDGSGNSLVSVTGPVTVVSTTLATEATVATLATEATAATLATEATAATLATEATAATLATEATAATLATEVTVDAVLNTLNSWKNTSGDLLVFQGTTPWTVDGNISQGASLATAMPVVVGGTNSSGNAVIQDFDASGHVILGPGTDNIGDVDVVSIPGTLDANNSSVANLGIGATFTGTATDVSDYSHITVFALADEAGAASGLTMEFSPDGTTWPTSGSTKHQFTIAADVSRTFALGQEARFFRVVYVNGGTAQTSFDLQTLLRSNITHETLHRVGDTVTADRSVKLRKSILVAQKPDTSFVNIDATAGGNLKVAVEEFDTSVFGQTTMSASLPVVLASDHSDIKITLDGEEITIADPSALTMGARFVYNPSNMTKTGNFSVQQTDTAVWTPAAGKKIVLMGAYFTSDAILTLELEDSNVDVIPPTYTAVKGGASITAGPAPIWIGDDDDTLDISSDQAGDFSVLVWGYEID